MGLLSAIFGLPLAPIGGVISLGEVIRRRAEEELHDPSAVRRELEQLEEARAAGEISAEDEATAQHQIVARLTPRGTGGARPSTPDIGR
jgi:hypothetical protein